MCRIIRSISVGFTFLGLLLSTSIEAVADAPVTIYGYCIGNQGPKAYFSAIFSGPREVAPALNEVNKNAPTAARWEQSFSAYLAQEHAVQASPRCFVFETLGGAQLNWGRQLQIAQAFGPDKYVETGWTYKSTT